MRIVTILLIVLCAAQAWCGQRTGAQTAYWNSLAFAPAIQNDDNRVVNFSSSPLTRQIPTNGSQWGGYEIFNAMSTGEIYIDYTSDAAWQMSALDREEDDAAVGDYYATAATLTALDAGTTDDFCVEAWLKPESAVAINYAFAHGGANEGYALVIGTSNQLGVKILNAAVHYAATITVPTGAEAHVGLCRDNSAQFTYFWKDEDANNGEGTNAGGAGGDDYSSTGTDRLFSLPGGSGQYDGSVNEVRVYVAGQAGDPFGLATPTTGTFATAFAKHHLAGPDADIDSTLTSYAVLRLSLNENTGTTATDSIGSAAFTAQGGGDGITWVGGMEATSGFNIPAGTGLLLPNTDGDTYLNIGVGVGGATGKVYIHGE